MRDRPSMSMALTDMGTSSTPGSHTIRYWPGLAPRVSSSRKRSEEMSLHSDTISVSSTTLFFSDLMCKSYNLLHAAEPVLF